MSFIGLLNTTVITQRLTRTGDKESWATSLSSCKAHIQPLDIASSAVTDGAFFKSYKMWTQIADILDGDRVIDGSTTYVVKGVEKHNYGNIPHLEIQLDLPQR